jgi:Domain of unknown function (DUF4386)
MSAAAIMKRITEASPGLKARLAGVFYLLTMLTAVASEFFLHGNLVLEAGAIEISGYVAVTLLLYAVFKPVNKNLSLLAALFNAVGLTLEALQFNPQGVTIGMVFHGFNCLLIGYLIFRSAFLPRILSAPMAFAGLSWLIFLSPPLTDYLSPYHLACGILGEGLVMLWLLAMGVNVRRWEEQSGSGCMTIVA